MEQLIGSARGRPDDSRDAVAARGIIDVHIQVSERGGNAIIAFGKIGHARPNRYRRYTIMIGSRPGCITKRIQIDFAANTGHITFLRILPAAIIGSKVTVRQTAVILRYPIGKSMDICRI